MTCLFVRQHDLEEVLKLQHRVRVLERSLENETKISHDLYTEVCQKTYSCEQLGRCLYCNSTLQHVAHIVLLQAPQYTELLIMRAGHKTMSTSLHKTCTLLFSEAHCKQLESRVEKLVDLQDLEDELQHCRESLAMAERSLVR